MSCKKILLLFIIIIAIAVGVNYFLQQESVDNPVDGPVPGGEMMVGNDRDEHGCIGSAGYVTGGSGGGATQDTDEYAPDTWTSKTDMPTPGRYDHSQTSI